MERRMFHREPISINGELVWFTKSRFRGKQRHHSFIRTKNVSLEGARVEFNGVHEFSAKAKARLQLGILPCDVTVLECKHTADKTTLRVVYKEPSQEFIAYLEEQLPTITADRELYEGKWLSN